MWNLGPHNRSLLMLYQFRDPDLECQYLKAEKPDNLLTLRIYLVVSFIMAIQEISTEKLSWGPLPPIFWVHVTIAIFTTLMFAFTWCSKFIKQRPLTAHLLLCIVLTTYDGAMIPINGLRVGLHDLDPQYSPFLKMVTMNRAADAAIMYGTMYNFIHWVCHALQGLNLCTLTAFVTSTSGFLTGMYTSQHGTTSTRQAFLVYNLFITSAMIYIALVIERSRRANFMAQVLLSRELQASQMADSILNHMLKNTLADVAANIEIFLEGSLGRETLVDAIASLRRGIRGCKERNVYLKLVSHQYIPVLNRVNLRQFGQQLVMGRQVTTSFWDATVLLDAALYNLILENALSNAYKHGHPERPAVQMKIIDMSAAAAAAGSLPPGRRRLCIQVCNAADPQRPPLTPETTALLFNSEVKVRSTSICPVLSDGVGLGHCQMAAKLAGVTLSLTQQGDLVTFMATSDVEMDDNRSAAGGKEPKYMRSQLAERCPNGLRFMCIDDSLASQRLLVFYIQRWCNPEFVRCFGSCEADVETFLDAAILHADVVVMDQNLEYSMTYLGTDLAKYLLSHGFLGLICIRSANDSMEDRANYAASGAHCCLGKDMLGVDMVEEIKAAYVQLKGIADLSEETDSSMHDSSSSSYSQPAVPQSHTSISLYNEC